MANSVPWPFAVRPDLEALSDPEAREIAGLALVWLGVAAALVAAAAIGRRGLVPAVLAALTVAVLQGPSLRLFFVAAHPTSFWLSPTGFSAASIVEGRAVFALACTSCHGSAGDGVGGKGAAADLRRRHIWGHPPGDLFWFVSHGIPGPDGGLVMPGFAAALPEQARWSAIDYIQALNAGGAVRGLSGWPHRVPAPDLPLTCARMAARSIKDLRGKAIHLILGMPEAAPPRLPSIEGVEPVTVALGAHRGDYPPGIECWGSDGAEAYAILAGVPDGGSIQARFLIDPAGVLRSVRREADGGWGADPLRLLEDLRTICTVPLRIEPGDDHEHRR